MTAYGHAGRCGADLFRNLIANAHSQIRTPTAVLEIKALYCWRSFTIN